MEDDEVVEEEDNREGVGEGHMTRGGQFGRQTGRPLEFLHSRGISGTVGERKRGRNRVGQDKCRAGKGWAGSQALRNKKQERMSHLDPLEQLK